MPTVPKRPKSYVLSRTHYEAFGVIIQGFARYEWLLQVIMSALAGGANLYVIMTMTSGLGYLAKHDAVKAVLRGVAPPASEHVDRINWFIGETHQYNGLRNHIAHSLWNSGDRPNSVKPVSVSARGGKATILGMEPNEADYTLEELIQIANKISRRYDEFHKFLHDVGMMGETEDSIAENSAAASSGSGSS